MKRHVKIWMIGSYLFVLVLFLGIYLGVQRQTESKIQEIYIEKQLAVMQQTMMAMDKQTEAVVKLCLAITQEPYVQYFPFVSENLSSYDMENVTKLVKNIRNHYTADPLVEDFYIFYEKSGRIANAGGFFREKDFYQMEWSYIDQNIQRCAEELLRKKKTDFLPAAWMKNGSRRTENITFFYDFSHGKQDAEARAATLVVLLKTAWLDDMVSRISERGKTSIRMAKDGKELYSYQGEEKLTGFSADAFGDTGWEEELTGRVVSWEGDSYLLTRLRSERTDWVYESVIPYAIITRQIQDAVRPMLAGLFLYLLVGIPACMLLAIWNYSPIRRIANQMQAIGFPENAGAQSELEYIHSGISNLHKKYEELELKYGSVMQEFDDTAGKLKKNRERIQEGILLQLLGGYWKDDKEIAERLGSLGIVFPYPDFCVAAVQVEEQGGLEGQAVMSWEELDARDKALCLFVLKNVIQEYLRPFGTVFPVLADSNRILLLMNLSEQGITDGQISPELERAMLQMKEYFRSELQISISLGVGTVCSQFRQLNESRRLSQRALEYRFIIGKSSLVLYDRLGPEEEQPYHYGERIEKQLLGIVSQRDGAACERLLDHMYADALERRISVSEGRYLHMLLADIAIKAIGRVNVKPMVGGKCQDIVSRILSSETLPEVFPAVQSLFELLCEGQEDGEELGLGKEIMGYIAENCCDPAFSLQMCAEHFDVSQAHLSRTIRAVTGQKFIDIVNRLRLDCAKRYLLDTDKKMEEIAQLSGYGTVKSFFRNFKQAEGVPPGVWRKQMQK